MAVTPLGSSFEVRGPIIVAACLQYWLISRCGFLVQQRYVGTMQMDTVLLSLDKGQKEWVVSGEERNVSNKNQRFCRIFFLHTNGSYRSFIKIERMKNIHTQVQYNYSLSMYISPVTVLAIERG
jgi:hypothetical protein